MILIIQIKLFHLERSNFCFFEGKHNLVNNTNKDRLKEMEVEKEFSIFCFCYLQIWLFSIFGYFPDLAIFCFGYFQFGYFNPQF
ncbi:hypothetical protein DERF_005186 [Dermatophagoides farinae]|uniref:Uncharacterized protein n=1 Tax=Dermatophagoides farinae TaxID=6954 RepID=A0A922I4T5_DERFA|nr:hypothetical protein DERF_005186 [Dermatophagoides farinae]